MPVVSSTTEALRSALAGCRKLTWRGARASGERARSGTLHKLRRMADDQFIKDVVKQVAETQQILNYSIIKGDKKDIGDNYFGNLLPLTISGLRNGRVVTLNVLLKCPPTSEFLRNQGPVTFMYEREIFVYTKLLPHYELMQRALPVKYRRPKCFLARGTPPEELLVLQDLRSDGFRHSEGMFFDLEHTLIAVKAIGRFNGLSMALEMTDTKIFGEFSKACWSLYKDDVTTEFFAELLRVNLLKSADGLGGKWAVVLTELSKNISRCLKEATVHAKRKVIGHSDVWKNNILFKYEDGHPSTACIIDYQTTQLQSPAVDIMYLITTSTNADQRKTSFKTILQTYYSTLSEVLEHFSIDLSNVYTFRDLEEDVKAAAPACVILANTSFRNWLGHGLEDIFDKKSTSTDPEKTKDLFEGVLKDIINDFQSYGFI